ncbi:MAG: DinB family protein [Anaerolineales bacterium]|nr:DinB family protein [Anaerolineales bacterium]
MIKESFVSQYLASLEMLKNAINHCPETRWNHPEDINKFWHVAFHVLFYTHFYLFPNEESYQPWEGCNHDLTRLAKEEEISVDKVLSREVVLTYLDFIHEAVPTLVEVLDLEAESGFYWLPFNKFEHLLYILRHLMQHTGELMDRLGTTEKINIEPNWIGMKS